jgi:hypothetical protein
MPSHAKVEFTEPLSSMVSASAAERLRVCGHVAVDNLWGTATRTALSEEARAIFPSTPIRQGRAGAPRQATAADAPLLAQLHFSLMPVARALTGQLLVPSYGWYNYYPHDDGIWLHTDVDGSDLAMLATVVGTVGPLHLRFELQGASQEELDAIQTDPGWDENSGVRVAYPALGVLAHRGRNIPHHRPGRVIPSMSVVAALHYTTLL